MKIFIANVPHQMSETELKTALTQYGQVSSVKLLTDKETGKRKGFGFIEMPVYDQAEKAMKELNGKEFYGRGIALSVATDKPQERGSTSGYERPRREQGQPKQYGHHQGEVDGNRW